MSATIRETELAQGLLRWTIDHLAKRNALTPAMLAQIERRAAELRGEIVLLDAAPGPCFCAGFDVDAFPEGQIDPTGSPDDPLIRASLALQDADAITIALVHGDAFGAGVELAAACDLRFATPEARFVVPAARIGLLYHPRGVQLLHRVFGPALARRMLLAADEISADEALKAGALAALHPEASLLDAALAFAERLRLGAPQSLRAHRDLLRALDRGAIDPDVRATYDLARRAAFASDDFREGREAARGRRRPRFSGG